MLVFLCAEIWQRVCQRTERSTGVINTASARQAIAARDRSRFGPFLQGLDAMIASTQRFCAD